MKKDLENTMYDTEEDLFGGNKDPKWLHIEGADDAATIASDKSFDKRYPETKPLDLSVDPAEVALNGIQNQAEGQE